MALNNKKYDWVSQAIIDFKKNGSEKSFEKAYQECEMIKIKYSQKYWSIEPDRYHDLYIDTFFEAVSNYQYDHTFATANFISFLRMILERRCKTELGVEKRQRHMHTCSFDQPIDASQDNTATLGDVFPSDMDWDSVIIKIDDTDVVDQFGKILSKKRINFIKKLIKITQNEGQQTYASFGEHLGLTEKEVDNRVQGIQRQLKDHGYSIKLFQTQKLSQKAYGRNKRYREIMKET